MLGGTGSPGGASPGGDELLTVTVVRDALGYGMKVSGDNPVYVQSVKEHGAAWRAGLRSGDRILRVDSVPVHHHTHQQVVHMIRANPSTVLTVQQHASRHKTPITAPVPVNSEKLRQLEVSKAQTVRLMLEQEQKYIRDLRNELSKVPDVRKQAQLESAEARCAKLQHEIDTIMASQPASTGRKPASPPPHHTGFLSGLPRSLSNLTGQSLRNLRQARQSKPQETPPPLVRQNSDEAGAKRRHGHNNTVPLVPTTCLDNVSPPPLPPRYRTNPPNPIQTKPKPGSSVSPVYKGRYPMHQSMPAYERDGNRMHRSSHSLDGELDGPKPNSIAMQMSYPLVNAPPPPLQTDNRGNVPVLHVRSQSSPEHLEYDVNRSCAGAMSPLAAEKDPSWRGTPPPGTPPPPYAHNTQPCADPQRAIISMEEDDSPASDNSSHSGLFSNMRAVRESKARMAVLLNWLLAERRCAYAGLLLVLTDGYRAAAAGAPTLRRWAYEIQSTFLMPNAVLQLNGVDENMANEIEHVLVNEYDKEEILRTVFRKARAAALEQLQAQLAEFQGKRRLGLATLYGPDDALLDKCDQDKQQEQIVVERVLCARLSSLTSASPGSGGVGVGGVGGVAGDAHQALVAAVVAAALALQCRPASVAAAAGGARASFLQRDKLYKQRIKQLAKNHPQPFVVRGHHLQLQALTSVGHCHHCDLVIWGLAPQAYVCTDCKLRVHRQCARNVEEGCCLGRCDEAPKRGSRLIDRIHPPTANGQTNAQDSNDKKSKKASSTSHFINMERSVRKIEDEPWDQTLTPAAAQERRDESDESLYESADCHSDAISASDDALPRLGKTPTMSKESLKLAITDEEVELRPKKSHRKTMSLSNPLEIVKNFGDEWFDGTKKDTEKHSDKKKSRESLWSEEDKDSLHGSTMKLDQIKENSKKGDSSQANSRKSSTVDPPKSRKSSKTSSVSALNFLRRKKTPTSSMKTVEAVAEAVDKIISTDELLNSTKLFLESEKRHSAIRDEKPVVETDSDEEMPVPKPTEQRRRLSRQTSRSKSKARGKSQSVKVNTLRKSHSGTLKKGKKKSSKMGTPLAARSRQASVVEHTAHIKKNGDSFRQSSWLFSGSRGEPRREGSTDETAAAAEVDGDADSIAKETPDKDHAWRSPSGGVRGVNRAESCRERDAPRRGKHRNASDPNRRANVDHRDLEPGAAHAPSGSSSSSSLSSRSNESNTAAAPADHQASQSDWSEEDEPLAAQWADSLPTHVLDSLLLSPRLRKRQEVIHELIVSEGSHVRWLKVLGGVFLRPLETQGALLPPEELRALFPNLPAVRERHQRLYMDLRALRTDANNHVVPVKPLAEAMLNTLGEVNYATHLSRFCRGQRMALEALRERRRKSKELHQFLAAREQLPLCGRLQLKDLLACVWQRLTKYQLLLESILKTMSETDNDCSGECDSEDDIARLRKALDTAKDVLQGVDMAIRTAENEHRLRNIQNKLEIRIAATGGEWDEARRLDLPSHTLRMEGDLAVRNDNNKKSNVLALMLSDCLVLLQREGERFALKPLAAGAGRDPLAPLVRWDKVLFRPNAACRNTFFLMNINGVQMHELSTSTNNEYATWVKHIQELPLAKPELKQAIPTPLHQPSRSIDEPGSNVSRKPSDASEKSNSIPGEDNESERDRQSLDRTSTERERDDKRSVEREERRSMDKEETADREEKHKARRPTVGRISTHCSSPPPPLLPPAAVRVAPPAAAMAQTARTAITHQEHLRRLDESISSALSAKCAVVAAALGLPPGGYAHLADLAVADTLGLVDVPTELRQTGSLSRTGSVEEEPTTSPAANAPPPDMHQLLLAAQAQVNQLSECLSGALSASAATVVGATARGRCDQCRPHRHRPNSDNTDASSPKTEDLSTPEGELATPVEPDALEALECDVSAAQLARRLVGLSSGLQGTVSALLCALPALAAERRALRSELCASRQRAARLQAALQSATQGQAPPPYESFALTDEISYPKEGGDQTIQDQPSNGG